MAAKKQAKPARTVAGTVVGYVFADEDGSGTSDPFSNIDEATNDAMDYLTRCSDESDAQVVFALVPMRRVAITITNITE